jgi:hypothetical protein
MKSATAAHLMCPTCRGQLGVRNRAGGLYVTCLGGRADCPWRPVLTDGRGSVEWVAVTVARGVATLWLIGTEAECLEEALRRRRPGGAIVVAPLGSGGR